MEANQSFQFAYSRVGVWGEREEERETMKSGGPIITEGQKIHVGGF